MSDALANPRWLPEPLSLRMRIGFTGTGGHMPAIMRALAGLLFALTTAPALANPQSATCDAIGRDLAAAATALAISNPLGGVSDAEMLAAFTNPATNHALDPLMGFSFRNEQGIHDLRGALDRLVAVEQGPDDSCLSATIRKRDRKTQETSTIASFPCENQSAELFNLKSHGYFLARLDLPQDYLTRIDDNGARNYRLLLDGIGAANEGTSCTYNLRTDPITKLSLRTAETINRRLRSTLHDVGPAPPAHEIMKNWLARHTADITDAYLAIYNGKATAMTWPPDVAPDHITLTDGPVDLLKSFCTVSDWMQVGAALRLNIRSITDLSGVQCDAAPPETIQHGLVRTDGIAFLVAVGNMDGVIQLNAFNWRLKDQTAQLGALASGTRTAATHRLTLTQE